MRMELIYLVREPQKRSCACVRQTLQAFTNKKIPWRLLLTSEQTDEWLCSHGTQYFRAAQELKQIAQDAKSKETILMIMDDTLVGPVGELDDLLDKALSTQADCCLLAKEASFYVLKENAYRNDALLMSIYRGENDVALVCQQEGLRQCELYDSQSLSKLTEHPMYDEPLAMVRDVHCPFFAQGIFSAVYDDVLQRTLGHQTKVFMKWLKEERGFDLNPLWDDLLRNCHMEDLFWNLHLTFVLPEHGADYSACCKYLGQHHIGLVMHLYYQDLLSESVGLTRNFPKETNIFITTDTLEKRELILSAFAETPFEHIEVRAIPNRGRDVSALVVAARDFCKRHEFVCFYHDKKVLQTKPGSIGVGFAYRMSENLFSKKDYVRNIVNTFRTNPRLGLLTPPPPHHGDYFFTLGTAWGPNFENTKRLYDRLGLHVPIAENKMPLAPLGTCFWFRSAALRPLFDGKWDYSDFPPEPNPADGTILHAFERIYPFVCAEAGYYPSYVLNSRYAAIEYTSLRHYVRTYNQLCFKHGMLNYQRNMRWEMADRLND